MADLSELSADQRRAALLSDRIVSGLGTLDPCDRKTVLSHVVKIFCPACGHDKPACACWTTKGSK